MALGHGGFWEYWHTSRIDCYLGSALEEETQDTCLFFLMEARRGRIQFNRLNCHWEQWLSLSMCYVKTRFRSWFLEHLLEISRNFNATIPHWYINIGVLWMFCFPLDIFSRYIAPRSLDIAFSPVYIALEFKRRLENSSKETLTGDIFLTLWKQILNESFS